MTFLNKLFFTRVYTNLFSILVFTLLAFLAYKYFGTLNKPVDEDQSVVIKYLDSINNQNKILLSRIDSLDLNKKEKIIEYNTITLKYDTLKIRIDSMPPLDATLFLLSKSRQLTDKGIE